jgi:hypothetical protein
MHDASDERSRDPETGIEMDVYVAAFATAVYDRDTNSRCTRENNAVTYVWAWLNMTEQQRGRPTWTKTQIDAGYRGPSCDFRVQYSLRPRRYIVFQGWRMLALSSTTDGIAYRFSPSAV